MLEKTMKAKAQLPAVVVVLLSLNSSPSIAAKAIDDWVAQNSGKSEKLLCKREVDGEYFFIARAGNKVRLGSRLDMTGYNGSHVFMIGWRFQNENNDSLTAKVLPIEIRDRVVQNGERTFAEKIQYQTLKLNGSKRMTVAVEIKKCPNTECDRQKTINPAEKYYTVKVCDVAF